MTTTATGTRPCTRAAAYGWTGQAEYAPLDPGSYGLVVAHRPTRHVRIVLNEDATPDDLAKGMVGAIAQLLFNVGCEAAAVAGDAIAQNLGGDLDAVAERLHAMAALPDEDDE